MMKKIVLFLVVMLTASLHSHLSAQAVITAVRQPLTAIASLKYPMSVDYILPVGVEKGKIEVISRFAASAGAVRASQLVEANAGTSTFDVTAILPEVGKLWDIRLTWGSEATADTLVYTTITPLTVYTLPTVTIKPDGVVFLPDAEEVDPTTGGYYSTSVSITVDIANLPADLIGEDQPTVTLSEGDAEFFSFNDPGLLPFTPIRSITRVRFSNQTFTLYSKLARSGEFTTNLSVKAMGYTLLSEPVVSSSPAPNLLNYTNEEIDGSIRRYNIVTPLDNTSELKVAIADNCVFNQLNIKVNAVGNASEVLLINDAMLLARRATFERDMPNSKWYFFTFPYEVRTIEMEVLLKNANGEIYTTQPAVLYDSHSPSLTPEANMWVCIYSGSIRARGFTEVSKNTNWTDIIRHRFIEANEPIAICIPANATLRVPSSSGIDYVITEGKDMTLHTRAYPAIEQGIDGLDNDWNMIGNPYLQVISSKDMGVAVVHIYNSLTDTYKIAMNNDLNGLSFDIDPYQPVFVQSATNVAISFVDRVSSAIPKTETRSVAWDAKSRVDLVLSNGSKLVVVENPEASSNYAYGEDGLYMGTMSSGTQSIYSITPLDNGKKASVSVQQQPSIASVPVRLTGKNNTITLGEYSNLNDIDQVLLCNTSGVVLADLKQTGSYTTSATSLTLKVVKSPNSLGDITNEQGYNVTYQLGVATIFGAEGKSIVVCDLMGRVLFQGIAPDNRMQIETPGRIIVK